jgi:hypothetical protein
VYRHRAGRPRALQRTLQHLRQHFVLLHLRLRRGGGAGRRGAGLRHRPGVAGSRAASVHGQRQKIGGQLVAPPLGRLGGGSLRMVLLRLGRVLLLRLRCVLLLVLLLLLLLRRRRWTRRRPRGCGRFSGRGRATAGIQRLSEADDDTAWGDEAGVPDKRRCGYAALIACRSLHGAGWRVCRRQWPLTRCRSASPTAPQ